MVYADWRNDLMTVKEFLEMHGGEEINLTLYDVKNGVEIDTTSHYMTLNDGLREEWKTAKVERFYIDDIDAMTINVRKKN